MGVAWKESTPEGFRPPQHSEDGGAPGCHDWAWRARTPIAAPAGATSSTHIRAVLSSGGGHPDCVGDGVENAMARIWGGESCWRFMVPVFTNRNNGMCSRMSETTHSHSLKVQPLAPSPGRNIGTVPGTGADPGGGRWGRRPPLGQSDLCRMHCSSVPTDRVVLD